MPVARCPPHGGRRSVCTMCDEPPAAKLAPPPQESEASQRGVIAVPPGAMRVPEAEMARHPTEPDRAISIVAELRSNAALFAAFAFGALSLPNTLVVSESRVTSATLSAHIGMPHARARAPPLYARCMHTTCTVHEGDVLAAVPHHSTLTSHPCLGDERHLLAVDVAARARLGPAERLRLPRRRDSQLHARVRRALAAAATLALALALTPALTPTPTHPGASSSRRSSSSTLTLYPYPTSNPRRCVVVSQQLLYRLSDGSCEAI